MNKKIKISVVIPVFNLEKYIERCILSVINQTLKEIEIIVINDGSLDKSPEIIKKYKAKDNRIITINQMNYGVSTARNSGIERASGKYITFLDGDDYLNHKMLEKMFLVAESRNANIVFCNLSNDKQKNINEELCSVSPETILNEMIEGRRARTSSGILFNLSLIKKNKIKYKINMKFGEDFLFTINNLVRVSSNILIVPEYLYIVEERIGSATRVYDINRFLQIETFFHELYEISDLNNSFQIPLYSLENYYFLNILSAVSNIVFSDVSPKNKVKNLNYIKKSNIMKVYLKDFKIKGSFKLKMKWILFKYSNVYIIMFYYLFFKSLSVIFKRGILTQKKNI